MSPISRHPTATRRRRPSWAQDIPSVALPTTALLLSASMVAFFYGLAVNSRWQLFALGLLALVAVIWPFTRVQRMHELVSVWGVVIFNVAAGITARTIYIATGTPDEETIQKLFLLGRTTDYFFWPAVLLVAGLLVTTITYFFVVPGRGRAPLPKWLENYCVAERRVHIVAICLIVLGFVAATLFVMQTGGLDLLRISAKRAASPGLNIDENYRGLGYLRTIARLVSVGFLVVLAYFATTRRRMQAREVLLLLGMFASASLIPVYASNRAGIIWPLLMAGAVLFYSGYRLRLRHLAVTLLVALAVLHYLGEMRRQESIETAEVTYEADVAEWTNTALLGRHGLELTKMGHLVNNIPEVLDQKYGSTVWIWGVAWVPREFWPEKPPIHVGPELGRLYGMQGGGGVPPAFYGEAYWNFGIPGVIIGAALLGVLLRWGHTLFQPQSPRDMVLIVLYSVGLIRLTIGVIMTGVGFGIFRGAWNVAMVVLILWLIRSPRHTRRYIWRA